MRIDHGLVSPTSDLPGVVFHATRRRDDAAILVLLIDGMLNPKAGWGQSILDGVEDALAGSGRTFQRIARRPGGASFPESWAPSLVGKVDLAVTAVGD